MCVVGVGGGGDGRRRTIRRVGCCGSSALDGNAGRLVVRPTTTTSPALVVALAGLVEAPCWFSEGERERWSSHTPQDPPKGSCLECEPCLSSTSRPKVVFTIAWVSVWLARDASRTSYMHHVSFICGTPATLQHHNHPPKTYHGVAHGRTTIAKPVLNTRNADAEYV